MSLAPPVLVLDLGNSRLKGAVHDAGALHQRFEVSLAELLDDAGSLPSLPPHPAIVCSVLDEAREARALARLEAALGRPPRRIGVDLTVPLKLDYRTPETLGNDRLVAAWAAWRLHPEGAVVIDGGSALTVDWVDARGVFRGGAIAPGLAAITGALKAAAPRLDWGRLDPSLAWPGRDSAESCRVGVTAAARGMVRELLRTARETAGPDLPLVVTGGDAPKIAALWSPEPCLIHPDLLLEGIGRLVAAGKHPPP